MASRSPGIPSFNSKKSFYEGNNRKRSAKSISDYYFVEVLIFLMEALEIAALMDFTSFAAPSVEKVFSTLLNPSIAFPPLKPKSMTLKASFPPSLPFEKIKDCLTIQYCSKIAHRNLIWNFSHRKREEFYGCWIFDKLRGASRASPLILRPPWNQRADAIEICVHRHYNLLARTLP